MRTLEQDLTHCFNKRGARVKSIEVSESATLYVMKVEWK